MRDRDEFVIGPVVEWETALDVTDAVQQPVAVDLQDLRDALQPLEAGFARAGPDDVVDEGPIDVCQRSDVGRRHPELANAGTQAARQRCRHRRPPQVFWTE